MADEKGLLGKENKGVISLQDTRHFDREGFSGDIYVDKNEKKGFTTLRITVNGKHPLKKMTGDTTRTYFVISGCGNFIINNQKREVSELDFVVIEPGWYYEYEGVMVLFENNISPSNTFTDELVPEARENLIKVLDG